MQFQIQSPKRQSPKFQNPHHHSLNQSHVTRNTNMITNGIYLSSIRIREDINFVNFNNPSNPLAAQEQKVNLKRFILVRQLQNFRLSGTLAYGQTQSNEKFVRNIPNSN